MPDQVLLRTILSATGHPPVKLLGSKTQVGKLPAAEALRLVITAKYDYRLNSKQHVKWLRIQPPTTVWQECWRTSKAAVLPPSIDWVHTL